MTRNLWLLLGVSLLFGLSSGIYDFILPFLLKTRLSFLQMGLIFALAGIVMFLARLYMGGLTDRWGRKHLYTLALLACGGATALTVPLPGFLWQFVLKTFRDTAALTREAVLPIILYEENARGFLNRIGKFRGLEFIFQAGGTLIAGGLLALVAWRGGSAGYGYQMALYLAGGVLIGGAVIWAFGFHEHWQPMKQPALRLRELLNFDMHPNLRLLAVSGIIFTFGMQLSHSIYLGLFFRDRFQQPDAVISLVLVLHRLTLALPLLVVGNLRLKNLRAWYIGSMLVEGVTMAASPLMPWFGLSAGIFLLHDLVGAGIWTPIQAMMIQRYSRPASRGVEVSKVLAWSSLGGVLGPLAAGWLAGLSPIWPFFFSGVFMALSAIPLVWCNPEAAAPEEAAAQPVAA